MDLKQICWEYLDPTGVAHDSDIWRNFVTAVMNLRVPYNVRNLSLGAAMPLCVCDENYEIGTVKYKLCIFYYCVKMFLQEQHFSNQLRGRHQTGKVMKLNGNV
jgi:hypothetical protein